MHGSMRRVRQKFAETEMNRHFGKTLATEDSHIYQTSISFTYTSNHHKLHIYTSHIHQTTTSFTYTSKPSFTYTTNPKLIKASIWVINGRKEFGRRSTYLNMKQNRFNAKYRWINGRNEVGRRSKPNRSRVRRVDLV